MFYPVDIHTHRLPLVPGEAIVNCMPDTYLPQPRNWYSVGLHPWRLDRYDWEDATFRFAFEAILCHPQVIAVGEAGLDKLASTPLARQMEAFRYQAGQADALGKPLIIHAVKTIDELLALRKELRPSVPWIIHGFRGKPSQADAYLRHGFYLSFGEKYNEDALRRTPFDKLFLETDESEEGIAKLYERAAGVCALPLPVVKENIARNIRKVFFSR